MPNLTSVKFILPMKQQFMIFKGIAHLNTGALMQSDINIQILTLFTCH